MQKTACAQNPAFIRNLIETLSEIDACGTLDGFPEYDEWNSSGYAHDPDAGDQDRIQDRIEIVPDGMIPF